MYYHGTEIERGRKAVKEQKLSISTSSVKREQWLGDGWYFYEYERDAYKWIFDMHRSNIKKNKYSNSKKLLCKFTILGCELERNEEREFTNFNHEHFKIFEIVKDKLVELEGHEVREGDVFNYLFEILKYKDNYDLVRWSIPMGKRITYPCLRTEKRQQLQICVKKREIITNITDLNNNIDEEKYIDIRESNENKIINIDFKNLGREDCHDKWNRFKR